MKPQIFCVLLFIITWVHAASCLFSVITLNFMNSYLFVLKWANGHMWMYKKDQHLWNAQIMLAKF